MTGQDFLDLLNEEESLNKGSEQVADSDFDALLSSDSPSIDKSKIRISSPDFDPVVTESQLDQIEQQNSPGIIGGTLQAAQGGVNELKGLYNTLSKTANYLHPVLKSYMKAALIPSIETYGERQHQTRKLANDIKTVIPELVRSSPEIASSIAQDVASSFGVEKSDQTNQLRVDPDVFLNKFREAPISTISDWTLMGAVFKKAMKLGDVSSKITKLTKAEKMADDIEDAGSFIKGYKHKTARQAMSEDKDFLRDMLSKMDENTKEAQYSRELHSITKTETPTIKDQLMDNRRAFLSIPKKELDNPEFARKVGNKFKENLDSFINMERGRLNASLAPIANNKVDKELLFSTVYKDLKDNFLISNVKSDKPGPFSAKIKSGFKGSMVENVLDSMKGDLTIKELNESRKRIDQAINFNDPKQSDKALMIMRSNMDNYIKSLKGAEQYREEASRVADRLQIFKDKQRKIASPGGGEMFAKNFFKTREDLEQLKSVLKTSDIPLAHSLRADLDILDSWHTWNRMWSQNTKVIPEFYMGYPMTTGMRAINTVAQPVAKSLIRTQLESPIIGEAASALSRAIPDSNNIQSAVRINRAAESFDTSEDQ